ncbi:unnamed protein product [Triticum turgidum subsp. durum]|uniref:Calcium uniporter protein C-terminal domain-containing protein n=1 Tax=Triticum turgidum subsp. durum TaxID=4567 RepID=A0A9R0Z508_TRITD|nr:unnamed protein product [Triticum turgidum subsp. durum]
MWRAAASRLLLHRRPSPATATAACTLQNRRLLSANAEFTTGEARRVVRLVGVEMLKRSLRDRSEEVISYGEFLEECVEAGAARTHGQAEVLARAMEQSGVVLFFRGKVYLHPEKVCDLVKRAVPFALTPENEARKEELKQLQKMMKEIEGRAHKHARRIICFGFACLIFQFALFFRLTYWEFSWDRIEPIAFFFGGTQLVCGYAYFIITSRNPSLQDFLQTLFMSRRRKLCAKQNFDMKRYLELQKHSGCPRKGDYCSQGRN